MAALVLLVFAFVFAIAATVSAPPAGRVQWGWLALACYFGSLIISRALPW